MGESMAQKLLDKCIPEPNSGCWLWTACVDHGGYGRLFGTKNGVRWSNSAHRMSYQIFKCEDPGENHVLHKCDNPYCINPDHLELGSHQKNMEDMCIRGRSRNKKFDITDEKVRQIREDKRTYKEISRVFGVGETMVYYIKSRKRRAYA